MKSPAKSRRHASKKSAAPFADAARIMWGGWAADIVGVAVMISSLGALNGWTLLMGQVPMAAAQDRLFPALFGRVSSRGVPAIGIIFSAILATCLILVQAAGSSGFAAFYSLVINLATMTAVVPYAFCALSVGLVAAKAAGGELGLARVREQTNLCAQRRGVDRGLARPE